MKRESCASTDAEDSNSQLCVYGGRFVIMDIFTAYIFFIPTNYPMTFRESFWSTREALWYQRGAA